MKAPRLVLLIVGIACTVVFLSVSYRHTITNDSDVSELRIGFEPSPWFRRTRQEARDGVRVSSEFNLISWSSVFGLAAVGSFLGYARLRRKQTV